jgi:prolyl-tRNA synthetase
MGALIMSHSDDKGLVIPPKLAPVQVVIVPVYKGQEGLDRITVEVAKIVSKLKVRNISVKYDDRDSQRPGWKFAEYELKGIPLRIAIGERDLQAGTVEIARRDTLEKATVKIDDAAEYIETKLEEIQKNLFNNASKRLESMTFKADTLDEFRNILDTTGGFVMAHWDGTPETEEKIKEETKATIRCIPLNNAREDGKCIYSGQPSTQRVLFARAY